MSKFAAPAKINLSLRILGKRDDGFHEVDLLMARLDLADELEFSNARSLTLTCDSPGVPTDESNLVLKAVREFEKVYGRPIRRRIHLTKRVPHGAGLGGGSSDAALTLLALNEELGTRYELEELSAMAANIGSDVPFFLNPVFSRCTGRGEIVTPVDKFSKWSSPILLVKPTFGVSTAEAYNGIHSARRMRGLPYGIQKVDGLELVNDLERPVFAKYPVLGLIKSWLLRQNGVRAAMMSGSGSTIFALTHTEDQAKLIAEAIKQEVDPTLFTYCGRVNNPDDILFAPPSHATQTAEPPAEIVLESHEQAAAPEVSEATPCPPDRAPDLVLSSDTEADALPPTVEAEDSAPCATETTPTSSKEKPAGTTGGLKKRGRKPRAVLNAMAEVEAARHELDELRHLEASTREALLAEGIDPDVKRRGRKPAKLAEFLDIQARIIAAEANVQALTYNLAKLEYER